LAFTLAGLFGGGGVILGLVLLELFDSTDSFGLAAVIVGVEIQDLVWVFFFVALYGVEEDVLVFVASGVGEVWVDGRVGGVEGWGEVGYGGWWEWEVGKGSGGCGVDGRSSTGVGQPMVSGGRA
jgi:hypothetical protein